MKRQLLAAAFAVLGTQLLTSAVHAQSISHAKRKVPTSTLPIVIETNQNYLQGILNGGPFGLYFDDDGTIGTSPDIAPTKTLTISDIDDGRPTDGPLTITFTDGSKLIQTSGYSLEGFAHIYYEDGPRKFRVELFSVPTLRVQRSKGK